MSEHAANTIHDQDAPNPTTDEIDPFLPYPLPAEPTEPPDPPDQPV